MSSHYIHNKPQIFYGGLHGLTCSSPGRQLRPHVPCSSRPLYFSPTGPFSVPPTYQVQAKLPSPQHAKAMATSFSSSTTQKALTHFFTWLALFHNLGHIFMSLWSPTDKSSLTILCDISFSGHSITLLHIFFSFITIKNDFLHSFCVLSAYCIRMYTQL